MRYRADATINRDDGVTEVDIDITKGRAIKRRKLLRKIDRLLMERHATSLQIVVTMCEDEMAGYDADTETDEAAE